MLGLANRISPLFTAPWLSDPDPKFDRQKKITKSMSILGEAAAGFIDNKRLGIMHRDNNFDYLTYVGGVVTEASREVNVEQSARSLAYSMQEIWNGLNNEATVDIVEQKLPSMLESFRPVFKSNTYDRPKK